MLLVDHTDRLPGACIIIFLQSHLIAQCSKLVFFRKLTTSNIVLGKARSLPLELQHSWQVITRFKQTGSGKHTSLLRYKIYYDCKKFYDTDPRCLQLFNLHQPQQTLGMLRQDIDDDQILSIGLQHLQGRFDFVFSYKIGKLNVELQKVIKATIRP